MGMVWYSLVRNKYKKSLNWTSASSPDIQTENHNNENSK